MQLLMHSLRSNYGLKVKRLDLKSLLDGRAQTGVLGSIRSTFNYMSPYQPHDSRTAVAVSGTVSPNRGMRETIRDC